MSSEKLEEEVTLVGKGRQITTAPLTRGVGFRQNPLRTPNQEIKSHKTRPEVGPHKNRNESGGEKDRGSARRGGSKEEEIEK